MKVSGNVKLFKVVTFFSSYAPHKSTEVDRTNIKQKFSLEAVHRERENMHFPVDMSP